MKPHCSRNQEWAWCIYFYEIYSRNEARDDCSLEFKRNISRKSSKLSMKLINLEINKMNNILYLCIELEKTLAEILV